MTSVDESEPAKTKVFRGRGSAQITFSPMQLMLNEERGERTNSTSLESMVGVERPQEAAKGNVG